MTYKQEQEFEIDEDKLMTLLAGVIIGTILTGTIIHIILLV